jgi:hypothetical protein
MLTSTDQTVHFHAVIRGTTLRQSGNHSDKSKKSAGLIGPKYLAWQAVVKQSD